MGITFVQRPVVGCQRCQGPPESCCSGPSVYFDRNHSVVGLAVDFARSPWFPREVVRRQSKDIALQLVAAKVTRGARPRFAPRRAGTWFVAVNGSAATRHPSTRVQHPVDRRRRAAGVRCAHCSASDPGLDGKLGVQTLPRRGPELAGGPRRGRWPSGTRCRRQVQREILGVVTRPDRPSSLPSRIEVWPDATRERK